MTRNDQATKRLKLDPFTDTSVGVTNKVIVFFNEIQLSQK